MLLCKVTLFINDNILGLPKDPRQDKVFTSTTKIKFVALILLTKFVDGIYEQTIWQILDVLYTVGRLVGTGVSLSFCRTNQPLAQNMRKSLSCKSVFFLGESKHFC